jgi:hypothetical protein
MATVRVVFPAGAQYGNALYRLRKTIKNVLSVEVHKQPDGALVVCADGELGSLLLLLDGLKGYSASVAES